MSGVHWCPTATESTWAGVSQLVPSEELLKNTLASPSPLRAAHTRWTPSASAAMAELLPNREKVSPLGQEKKMLSPQSTPPLPPVNWLLSNWLISETNVGRVQ